MSEQEHAVCSLQFAAGRGMEVRSQALEINIGDLFIVDGGPKIGVLMSSWYSIWRRGWQRLHEAARENRRGRQPEGR
jgi:hypothetical protein